MSARRALVILSAACLAVATLVIPLSPTTSSAAASAASSSSTYCAGAAAMVHQCADRYAVPEGLDVKAAAHDRGSLAMPCSARTTRVITCTFGDTKTAHHTVAVVGNSHAGHLIGALDAYGKTHHLKILLMRKVGCTGAVEKATWAVGSHADCFAWSKNVLTKIRSTRSIDTVVFASSNDSLKYLATSRASAGLQAQISRNIQGTLTSLHRAGKAVVVFGDTPGFYPYKVPTCVQAHRDEYDPCSRPASIGAERGNFVAHAAKVTRGIFYSSVTKYFCDSKKCHVVIGGMVVHVDEHHLTNSYSRSLAPYLGPVISKAIAAR